MLWKSFSEIHVETDLKLSLGSDEVFKIVGLVVLLEDIVNVDIKLVKMTKRLF